MNKEKLDELLEFIESKLENIEIRIEREPDFASRSDYQLWREVYEALSFMLEEMERKEIRTYDMVNRPKHYNSGRFETVDVIRDSLTEEEFRGYIKGNVLKYTIREKYKNGEEDLRKSLFYLNYLLWDKKSDGSPQD